MSEDQFDAWMEANRLNWNDRTAIHLGNRKGFYAIDRVKAGDNAFSMPSSLMWSAGGLFICHFGLDTIRLARRCDRHRARFLVHGNSCGLRGRARRLNAVCQGNAYDAPVLLDTQYDIAFVTWGLIIWLPDICRWAKVVASCRRQALTVSRRSTPVDIVARRSRWPIGADARLAVAGIGALCV